MPSNERSGTLAEARPRPQVPGGRADSAGLTGTGRTVLGLTVLLGLAGPYWADAAEDLAAAHLAAVRNESGPPPTRGRWIGLGPSESGACRLFKLPRRWDGLGRTRRAADSDQGESG